jgi:hypothetical protein
MTDGHLQDHSVITARLREQAQTDRLRITVHGHQEMMEEGVSVGEVRDVLLRATMVENYPDHKRGPCCLVCGQGLRGRNIHVVCTTSLELAIIITVYEPKPPKWVSAFERGGTK